MSFVEVNKLEKRGFIEGLNGEDLVVVAGLKETQRMIESGVALRVAIASDADIKIQHRFQAICSHSNIIPISVCTKEEFGEWIGISVPCALACITTRENYYKVANFNRRRKPIKQ